MISRCQRVRFGPLGHAEIEVIMKQNGVSEVGQISSISRLAEGSAGRAEMYEADILVLREQVLNLVDTDALTPLQDVFDLAEDSKPNQRNRLSQYFTSYAHGIAICSRLNWARRQNNYSM